MKVPKSTISLDPLGGFPHRRGDERRSAHPAIATHVGEARPLEHPDVLRYRRECHVEARRELADGPFSGGQSSDESAPGRIGEGAEGPVKGGGMIVNHVV